MAGFGEKLEQERLKRGVKLEQISAATKISSHHLRAIEKEEFSGLPGGVFNRGFVRSYARYLGLNQEEMVRQYLAASGEPEPQPVEADAGDSERAVRWLRLLLVIAILVGGVFAAIRLREPLLGLLRNEMLRSQTPEAPVTATRGRHTARLTPVKTKPVEHSENPIVTASAALSPSRLLVPAAAAEPLSQGDFTVAVRARQDAWLSITADNRRVMEGTLSADDVRRFHAAKQLVFVTGNAGGVEISFNGSPLGPLGAEGQRKQVTFTPAGIQP